MRLRLRFRFLLRTAAALAGCLTATAVRTQPPPPETTPERLEARGLPALRVYSPRDYDGHNQIWRIAADSRGRLYFGAKEEILSFDGISWTHIRVPGGAFMRGLAIDPQDRIWVAGVNTFGRLVPSAAGELVFQSLRPLLPDPTAALGDFRTITVLPDGVYFQSDDVLIRWHDDALQVWPLQEPVITYASAWQDRLVLSTPRRLVMPRPEGEWDPVPWTPEPFEAHFVSALTADGHDGWWIAGGRHGLMHTDGTSPARTVTGEMGDLIRASRLASIERLPDGRLLFPSYGHGLLLTDPGLRPLLHLDDQNGLPSLIVITTHTDSQRITWLGTEQGIVRADFSAAVQRFGPANGLGPSGAESVRRIGREIIFATNSGPLRMVDGEGPAANPRLAAWVELNDNLNVLHPLPTGVFAGGLRGLWWIKDGQATRLRSPSNIGGIHLSPRFPDHVFATHLNGLAVWRRDPATDWAFDHLVPDPRAELQSFIEDEPGDLWFGTVNDGIWRLHYSELRAPADLGQPLPDPRTTHYRDDHGLETGDTHTTVRQIGGRPLFLTGRGLFRFDPATQHFHRDASFGPAFDAGGWTAHHAVDSPRGGVWLQAKSSDNRGVPALNQIGRAREGRWEPLRLTDLGAIGFLDSLHAELVDGEEILWICGRAGLLRINVDRYLADPPPPLGATLLSEVSSVTGRILRGPAADEGPLRLPPGINSLRFRFGTPGLAGEPDGDHVSRLIGFNDGGEEPTPTGERTFTNLPPGRYVFEAHGRSADHHWSDPLRLEIIVPTPWWLTPLAKGVYLLAALLGVYGIVRWRTRRLLHQREALEHTVAARTAELANKAKALERLHQLEHDANLASRLAAETARLELLRYQLNPHFLFNSLNSIRALVHSAPESASEMVTKLAEFCRRTLNRGSDEMVSVDDEVEMARNYLEIEQVRWQDGLAVQLDIDPAASACALPQNLLLPLLENAIKYGGRTSDALLEVTLRIRRDGSRLVCAVSNTGRWVAPHENPFTDSTRIGLQNLRQRLHRHYGEQASVAHHETDGRVTVTVALPCRLPPADGPRPT